MKLVVQDIFRRIFLSNYRWQKSDIWSQASYRYAILWEAFLGPIYTHFSSHFSQQILMAEMGSVFGPIKFLLPVYRLSRYGVIYEACDQISDSCHQ
jgi:hypothetical protein